MAELHFHQMRRQGNANAELLGKLVIWGTVIALVGGLLLGLAIRSIPKEEPIESKVERAENALPQRGYIVGESSTQAEADGTPMPSTFIDHMDSELVYHLGPPVDQTRYNDGTIRWHYSGDQYWAEFDVNKMGRIVRQRWGTWGDD